MARSDKERLRNTAFRRWVQYTYGRSPTIDDFRSRLLWWEFSIDSKNMDIPLHYAGAYETEGHQEEMVTSRQQLLDMQAAAARQMAQAEAELKKYEAFPSEDDVLSKGRVIRYVRKFKRYAPMADHVMFTSHNWAGDGDVRSEPVKDVTFDSNGNAVEEKWVEYTYVAVYVNSRWYITGRSSKHTSSGVVWDDLLKTLVDGSVSSIEVLNSTAKFVDGAWSDVDATQASD